MYLYLARKFRRLALTLPAYLNFVHLHSLMDAA